PGIGMTPRMLSKIASLKCSRIWADSETDLALERGSPQSRSIQGSRSYESGACTEKFRSTGMMMVSNPVVDGNCGTVRKILRPTVYDVRGKNCSGERSSAYGPIIACWLSF